MTDRLIQSTMLVGLSFLASTAFGHAVFNERAANAGELTFLTMRITHGCGKSPTTEVRMKIPGGVTRVSPRYIPGWDIEVSMRKLDEPYEAAPGHVMHETADEVIWRGGPLPDGMYGEFQIRAMMPATPGVTLRFDTLQICETGEISWSQAPAEGQNPYELPEPAPFIRITE